MEKSILPPVKMDKKAVPCCALWRRVAKHHAVAVSDSTGDKRKAERAQIKQKPGGGSTTFAGGQVSAQLPVSVEGKLASTAGH